MHTINISPEIQAIARRRRAGKTYLFDGLDPTRTAHLIVDLQNGYMAEGAVVEVPTAREIVPNVNAISAALREAGGTNVFLRFTVDEFEEQAWSTWYEHFNSPENAARLKEAFRRGSEGWQLWPQLDVRDEDLKVDKTRFSAFISGTCELDETLKKRSIDTVIISGTVTNCCCESTARDAMQMNYKVIFVTDANAAFTDAAHNATLNSMCALYADVLSTQELTGVIRKNQHLGRISIEAQLDRNKAENGRASA